MPLLSPRGRIVQITKVASHGSSMCVILNRQVRDLLPLMVGDPVAVRQCGEMLLLERIDLDEYAKLRSGLIGAGAQRGGAGQEQPDKSHASGPAPSRKVSGAGS